MAERPACALIGCGNIGTAILKGALKAGVLQAATTLVIDAAPERRAAAGALGVRVGARIAEAAAAPRVLLAVKPQVFPEVAVELQGAPAPGDRLAVSVMAGWSAASIRRELGGERTRVIRAMPNIAAQIGLGMTAVAAGPDATAEDAEFAERLFAGVGATVRVREDQMDAATAVSGSGPAYVFLHAEAMEHAALRLGFDAPTARALVAQTMLGAAHLLAEGGASAAELRAAVTSRGGTTEAALRVLEERAFIQTVESAMAAARDRGRQLGR